MPPALTLVRHPRPSIPAGICYGRTDCAADAQHEQAVLDELLAAQSPQRVLSSPALRCRALAMRLSRHWRLPCEIEPRLQEMDFGRWEGLPWNSVPRAELDAWAHHPLDYPPGGGESLCAMSARVRVWLREVAEARTGVLAITHGGVMRLLTAWAQGAPLSSVFDVSTPGFGQMQCFRLESLDATLPPDTYE